jgi:putative endonuclease
MWYLYIVRTSLNTLYTGVTTDIQRRLNEHNSGLSKSAKYTRSMRPVVLVYSERYDSKSEALKREIAIKRLSHQEKLKLISGA